MFNLKFLVSLRFIFSVVLLSCIFFSLQCFGQVPSASGVAYVDPIGLIEEIISLIALVKAGTVSGWALAAAILTIVLQVFKVKVLERFFEKSRKLNFALTTTFGYFLAFCISMSIGIGWINSLIAAFLTSGGAIAIYSVWRAMFKK